jgi:hypothetical protein
MPASNAKARLLCATLVVLSAVASMSWGFAVTRQFRGGVLDFQAVYYGARCLMQGCDPYNVSQLASLYHRSGWEDPSDTPARRQLKTLYVNMPTAFILIAPFAALPWGPAHLLWMALICASFILAALLMWDIAAADSLGVATFLVCIVMANSEVLFATGNTAGLVVSLCIVAAWCFVKDRFIAGGMLCFIVSLVIKPHDAGLVWLLFLLAGGAHRKRAIQIFAVTAVIGLASILWLSHVAPHWLSEMRANLATISGHGGLNEPGPGSITSNTAGMVVDLQAAASVIWNKPLFYNLTGYLITGAMLLIWMVKTVRSRFSESFAWFGLAAVAPITMLITYHRPYDTKLLLLAVPGCAMLWVKGGAVARTALGITTAGVIMTGDIALATCVVISKGVLASTAGWSHIILAVLLTRPASLALLAMAIFYLWIYVRYALARASIDSSGEAEQTPVCAN